MLHVVSVYTLVYTHTHIHTCTYKIRTYMYMYIHVVGCNMSKGIINNAYLHVYSDIMHTTTPHTKHNDSNVI